MRWATLWSVSCIWSEIHMQASHVSLKVLEFLFHFYGLETSLKIVQVRYFGSCWNLSVESLKFFTSVAAGSASVDWWRYLCSHWVLLTSALELLQFRYFLYFAGKFRPIFTGVFIYVPCKSMKRPNLFLKNWKRFLKVVDKSSNFFLQPVWTVHMYGVETVASLAGHKDQMCLCVCVCVYVCVIQVQWSTLFSSVNLCFYKRSLCLTYDDRCILSCF